ncbi:hypothetical protein ACQ4PT_013880 [Festuca glaucescens]
MVKKRKALADDVEEDVPRLRKRVQNRASPSGLVKLYEFISVDQSNVVATMELDSLLGIKCHCLNNKLIKWFADGTIPLTSRVFEILKDMTEANVAFKHVFVMYVICNILSPTTRNHVSNRCYPVMANIENVHELQWCKFVVDQLHDELSKGRFTQGCLFYLQLLYVDSLDVSGLDIELPEGRFVSNIWSKENIDKVLLADLQNDGKSFGRLELKRQFGLNYTLFGGAMGFNKWFDTCTDPSCSVEQKAQVANLMGIFASGIVGLMGSLVQGWTSLNCNIGVEMANKFGDFAEGIITGGASSSAGGARVTRASTCQTKSALTHRRATGKSPILPPDNDILGDGTDSDDNSEEDVDKYLIVTRKNKGPRGLKRVGGDDNIVPHSAPITTKVISSENFVGAPASGEFDGKLVPGATLPSDINIPGGMRDSTANSDDNAVLIDRNDGLNVSASAASAELVEAVGVNKNINVTDYAANPDASVAMDVADGRKVADSAVILQAPVLQGNQMAVAAVVAEALVLCVYKSEKRKGKLHTLRQKYIEIRDIVCNELGITAERVAFGATDKLNDAKKATPRRKQIPKSKSNLLKKQATRSSPRLARHRTVAGTTISRPTTSVIELDRSSPEVSPSRVHGAAASNEGIPEQGDDSASDIVPLATVAASPVPSLGPSTDPEVATIPEASTLPEAPSVDTVGSGKGKMPVKDENDIISLDDLVIAKIGAHGNDRLQKSRQYIQQKIDFVTDAHAYCTPAMTTSGNVVLSASITPKTQLRTLSFPILQTLGIPKKGKKPIGHCYMLSVNMPAKRFEILDSLRDADDTGMIEHANMLVDAIKSMYRINYLDSRRQIDNFELMYIPMPKQNNG